MDRNPLCGARVLEKAGEAGKREHFWWGDIEESSEEGTLDIEELIGLPGGGGGGQALVLWA